MAACGSCQMWSGLECNLKLIRAVLLMLPLSWVLGGGCPSPGKVGTEEGCGDLETSLIHHARAVTQGASIPLVGWIPRAFPETQTESGDVAEAEGNSLQTTETALSTLLN